MTRPLAGRLLLVVEEQAFIRFDIADALQEVGAEPILANSVPEALSLVEEMSFSAAVLDDAGNSTALCQRLKERGIPFLICTSGMDFEKACQTGPILRKPVNMDRLIATLKELTEQPAAPNPSTSR